MDPGRMSVTFRLRLAAAELDRWRAAAWLGRESVSELVRRAVERELEGRRAQVEEERAREAELDPAQRLERMNERLQALHPASTPN